MTSDTVDLHEVLYNYLDRRGGVVIERLVNTLRKICGEDVPELQSEDALKEYVSSKPDEFRIAVSVNNVERARLANPRRPTQGIFKAIIPAMEAMGATQEEGAVPVGDIMAKVAEEWKDNLGENEELPYDLQTAADFEHSLQRLKRANIADGKAWLAPPVPRKPRAISGSGSGSAEGNDVAPGAGRGERRGRANGVGKPRTARVLGTPREARDTGDLSAANDATLIADLVYKKLCERGAVDVDTGLTVKLLLRLVSIDFKEARPDSDPASMNSLRVFKMLLSQVPGLRRQRPRAQPARSPRRGGGRPRFAPELIVWLDKEEELVEAIKEGLPEGAADIVLQPDILENAEELEAGTPVTVQVLEQESWTTKVVGPTANEDVLSAFLEGQASQSVWGFETEHRVGLRGKPAGKIAVIVLSDMHDTIIWDVHVGGIPQALRDFFANEEVYKAGVRVGPKVQKLRKQFDVVANKFVELADVAHGLKHVSDEEKGRVSMRIITQNVLNTPAPASAPSLQISRPPGIRDSNWELRPLTKRQYTYAVEDGFVTALLFMQLVSELHRVGEGTMLNESCVE